MKRLTTDNPDNNFETAMNYVCGGGWATIRAVGYEENVPLTDWAKAQCIAHGCDEFPGQSAEEIDETICDCIMDGEGCPVAMAYAFATQAVHLRDRLKAIEEILGDDYDLIRIHELVQAEKDGRLAVLPVKEGTKIYRLSYRLGGIYEIEERYFSLTYYNGEVLNKTIFLTREEAEAALKGIKKTEDLTPPSEPQL